VLDVWIGGDDDFELTGRLDIYIYRQRSSDSKLVATFVIVESSVGDGIDGCDG
jgi:hypothetical protein